MTEENIVTEAVSKCRISCTTTSGRSCQSTSCGGDEYPNYNPMKTVIA